ncbi:RNase adapter RapZ [Microbulbifer thermotolerans]|uniref:RNase adapter RapZ n=1 Tax=Microbulbifer thermotolerans TaxID=252514 RepID=A0A143HJX2_MICTH|nr:RNase adapter RapZ [Microbulbifer thermotolerans]AMX02025.1 RNase adaptor protein RapZ [Microbulbifer thermotolerans]MCX2780792.1 RNase adapter RapZ [Microbulbifer thermotolerans]MCX2783108.1 RNase adapter RapZ [Microbulbifer thermotolerans]MCX2794290.1 RNase adapter RapZ [Microbulbifer thermotolerans]MCX2800688.1 RNase adapter RapZ [Microbulbifer thermotolerans]
MRLVIISGRSGSGKSSALQLLEDVGFNCIDNLPASLLPELVRRVREHPPADETREAPDGPRLALGIDARNLWQDVQQAPRVIGQLRESGLQCDVIYLDARSPVLVQRFSETRRKHPLSDNRTHLLEALNREKELLAPLAAMADLVIDTSSLSLHQLRDLVKNRVVGKKSPGMAILFQSFGFKHGVPVDADLVFDLRCLPNPYWVAELRQKTGQDPEVVEFLRAQPETDAMERDITNFLQHWLPSYQQSNRSYTCVAVGCTGGRHRSVYMVEQLAKTFAVQFDNVQIRHREQQR